LISNLGNDASPVQLPSVHHNTSCGGCASDAEAEKIMQKEDLVNKT